MQTSVQTKRTQEKERHALDHRPKSSIFPHFCPNIPLVSDSSWPENPAPHGLFALKFILLLALLICSLGAQMFVLESFVLQKAFGLTMLAKPFFQKYKLLPHKAKNRQV